LFHQKKETIGSEVVNVVKPYTPTISDAFKIKEMPNLDDDGNAKSIRYTIFSFQLPPLLHLLKEAEGVRKQNKPHV
jgi:hypothetical protein